MSIEQLVDITVLLLRAMEYKCERVPTKLMLVKPKVRLVGSELVILKRKLKELFGAEGGTNSFVPLSCSNQADMVLVEEKRPAPFIDEQFMRKVEDM